MLKKSLYLISYTLLVIVISSLITTAYFHYFVLNQNAGNSIEQNSLRSVSEQDIQKSPIKDENSVIELFSYACHYCSINEKHVDKLESRIPQGSRLIRLHVNGEQMGVFSNTAPLFATLTVMGIEPQYRESAYKAVIKDKIDLGNPQNRDRWLQDNGIDLEAYTKASQSQGVQDLLSYMSEVSKYYKINATPTFVVNKKWLAIQDRDFPAFSDHLLSLLQHDKPLEQ
ncbi:thiol:disulfide interchange protein [Chania multitudinisentens RB-25]|uniref:Thiol:disulfide interchange protein n=1 Tax=Chania multitudinisentens RB-25 TaxID=1441930 RepID=W0L4S7_9GAMM|nr:DsbA family protein [Chania multitudinisentens]AHG18726.1 thiol:disulfide interchange protein [Chania multitudinisentens RB-25]